MKLLKHPSERAVSMIGTNGSIVQGPIFFAIERLREIVEDGHPERELWITSFCEGKHSKGSFHPWGWAFDGDIVPDPPVVEWQAITHQLKNVLTSEYDVVLEDNPRHLHVEFDVKR